MNDIDPVAVALLTYHQRPLADPDASFLVHGTQVLPLLSDGVASVVSWLDTNIAKKLAPVMSTPLTVALVPLLALPALAFPLKTHAISALLHRSP